MIDRCDVSILFPLASDGGVQTIARAAINQRVVNESAMIVAYLNSRQ